MDNLTLTNGIQAPSITANNILTDNLGVQSITISGSATINNLNVLNDLNTENLTSANLNTGIITSPTITTIENDILTQGDSITNIISDINDLNQDLEDNYYTKVETSQIFVDKLDYNPVKSQVQNNTNDINNIINTRIPNLQTQLNGINVVNTNLQNQITNNLNSANNQFSTVNNNINTINFKITELEDLNTGNYDNVILSNQTQNIAVNNNQLSPQFYSVSINKSSNRQFILNFPISIRTTHNSNLLESQTVNLRLTNLVVRVNKNGSFFRNINADAVNTLFGTPLDTLKSGTGNAGASGNQYYGNFYILFQPDYTDVFTGDNYTFQATPTIQWDFLGTSSGESLTSVQVIINTTVQTTLTTQSPITYLNSTSTGFQELRISGELPVNKPNTYLGGGLINYFPLLEIIYPIGHIFMSASDIRNPRLILNGFGFWEQIEGRFLRSIVNLTDQLRTTGGSTFHNHRWHTQGYATGSQQTEVLRRAFVINRDVGDTLQAFSYDDAGNNKDLIIGNSVSDVLIENYSTSNTSSLPPFYNIIMWRRIG